MLEFVQWLIPFGIPFFLTACCTESAVIDAASVNKSWNQHITGDASPKLLGKFPFSSAAFTSLYPNGYGANRTYDLLLTSFGMWSTDAAMVRNVGKYMKEVSSIKPESLTDRMKWPNDMTGVPPEVFRNDKRLAVIPDGFLVPFKGDGSVTLIELDPSHRGHVRPKHNGAGDYPRHKISQGSGEWFYHRVLWRDMDKDGRLDALTCRAHKPIIGPTKSNLVWFRQPYSRKITHPWDLHVMESGPDVYVAMVNMTNNVTGTKEVIISAEFFKPRFRIFWTEEPKQNWAITSRIKYRDIDHVTSGAPFDVMYADINGDSRQEIVLTINSPKHGSIVAYEVPDDFRTGDFKKHVLASGYSSHVSGTGTGGPGSALLLSSKQAKTKPSILLSGDDSALVSLLTPVAPNDPSDWSYKRNDFLLTKNSTVGGLSVADVDNDGRMEMFAPSYQEGLVYVYQFD